MDTSVPTERNALEMEVLVLGLCRTGTMSMKIALEELGCNKAYHMSETFAEPTHPLQWIDAMRGKFEGGIPFKKEQYKSLLADFSAVTDIPAACFAEELMDTYPDAKIILTTRSSASWRRSMLLTIHALQNSRINRILLPFTSQHTKSLVRLVDLVFLHYFRGNNGILSDGEAVLEDHNALVIGLAKKRNRDCLVFELGDGWKKLCTFLEKQVPERDFPRVNDAETWRKEFRLGWNGFNIIFCALAILPVLIGVWIYTSLRSR